MSYIDKWDGKLPTVAGENGSMLIDITALLEQIEKEDKPSSSAPVYTAPETTDTDTSNSNDE